MVRLLSLFTEQQVGDDHAVVGFSGDGYAAALWLELAGGVDVVDAEDGETSVEGVSPAAADGGKCVIEISGQLTVYDVGGTCVKIPAEDGGCVGEGTGLFKYLEDCGEFLTADGAVELVAGTGLFIPEAHVGGGGSEVDVDDFDLSAAG